MCVSAAGAEFSATKLAVWLAKHPVTGKAIVVLAYQNTVRNMTFGPNAMLLHFPALAPMTQENFVDARADWHIVNAMVNAVAPVSKSVFATRDRSLADVKVFNHDIYTVVLAGKASLVRGALKLVPEERRPTVSEQLLSWYDNAFSGWPLALCCFDNRRAAEAAPLVIWYEPIDTECLLLPGIDCHTGDVPDLWEQVEVDHVVMIGSATPEPGFRKVWYDKPVADPFLQSVIPEYVAGSTFKGRMQNGDFLARPGDPEIRRGILFV